jgi:hypothetical protein
MSATTGGIIRKKKTQCQKKHHPNGRADTIGFSGDSDNPIRPPPRFYYSGKPK